MSTDSAHLHVHARLVLGGRLYGDGDGESGIAMFGEPGTWGAGNCLLIAASRGIFFFLAHV